MKKATNPVPAGHHTITPQLTLDDAASAIEWYKKALGATEKSRAVGPDGKIMHAELQIGDSPFMVNDAMMHSKGPKAIGGAPASFWIYVADCDTLYNRAIAAGGKASHMGAMADQFWGDRAGSIADPAGFSWWIASRKEDLALEDIRKRAEEVFKKMGTPAAP